MKTRTGIRMVMALFILALALGSAGFPTQEANAGYYCHSYASCEHNCLPSSEACYAGTAFPECGGNYACCDQRLSSCWACCIWY